MPSFGYSFVSSGAGTFSNTHVGSLFENNSGGNVYVDQIELQNVTVARTATFQCAIYSDYEGYPNALLGVSDILSSITTGATIFPLSNPVGVSDGQSVWLFIRTDSTLNVSDAVDPSGNVVGRGPGFGYGGGSGFPSYFQLGYGPLDYVVPLVASGSDVDPGTSDVEVPLFINEPLAEGESAIQVPLVMDEPLSEGYPDLQVSLVMADPLSEGYSTVQVSLLMSESLIPVAPELPMSTIPFPGFGNSTADPSIPAAANPFGTSLPGLAFSVHKKPGFKTNIKESPSGTEVRNMLAEYPRWTFQLTYEFLEDRTGANSSLKTILGFFLSRRGAGDSWLFKDPDDYLVVNGPLGTADGVTTQFPLLRDFGGFLEKIGQVDTDNDINLYLSVEESTTIPVTPGPYTVTVAHAADFDEDLGVIKDGTTPMTRVTGSPAAGQYSVASGVYTFNAADQSDAIVISYRYDLDPTDYTVTMPNLIVFDSAPAEGAILTGDFQFFFACRFVEDEMDFEKFADKLWNLQECDFRSIIQ